MAPKGSLLEVNGTRLFVDVRGDRTNPPLLYIHGGPGMSCWDFMRVQGDRLAERLCVIGVDQRGLLRSDPLPEEPPLTVELLVADFEALRETLGFDSWTILGHSAGGAYALDYAVAHPESASAAIFDCPGWDCESTDRYRLPEAARMLDELGDHETARRCRELAARSEPITGPEETYELMQRVGDRWNELFFVDMAHAEEMDRTREESELSEQDWSRGKSHWPLLAELYRSRFPQLSNLSQPSILLRGRGDLVAAPVAIDEYRRRVPDGSVRVFDDSGHFPCFEEPDAYAEAVADFVLATSAGRDE